MPKNEVSSPKPALDHVLFIQAPTLNLLSGSHGEKHRNMGLGQFSPLESGAVTFPSHVARGAARVHPRMLRNGKIRISCSA